MRLGEIGFAAPLNLESTTRSRLDEVVHRATADQPGGIDAALHAALSDG